MSDRFEIIRAKPPIEKIVMEFTEGEIEEFTEVLGRTLGMQFSALYRRFLRVQTALNKENNK